MTLFTTKLGSLDLSPGGWALAAVGTFLFAYTISAVLAWQRLRHFAGPRLGSFSYLWIIRTSLSGEMGARFRQAQATYDSGSGSTTTIRIGPNELLTSDPDAIRRTSAARTRYKRSTWYKMSTIDPYDDAMLSTLDGAAHDRIKAQTAPGYAGKDNPGLEGEVDAVLGEMVERIRGKYAATKGGREEGKPLLDFANMAQYFTLDSISKVAFGEEFGLVKAERDIYGHIGMLYEMAPAMVTIAAVPYFRAVMGSKIVLSLLGPKPTDKKGFGPMLAMGERIVGKRFTPDAKDQQDMLGSFIRHGLTQRQCETEALVQIIAGSDTTATTIRATLLYLMSTPRAYKALQAEIDAGIASSAISSPVSNAEANELPYLQGVILEGLRLHPPFTGLPFKVVPPEGDTMDGRRVPGGTLVAPNFAATGRHRGTFGPDADVFRPERWIEAGPEQRGEMRRVAEMVFGYGRWGCAGKMIAFLELNKVFVELLRRFDFQLVNPSQPWESINHNLYLQRNMWVAVSQREP
ncbi:Pisatin demethylase [Staphylotrichum tortipilum]|uniref:Cytochrome P450 monooxygenase ABA1 n=1 Tax=Staphylotrichum tortipilum TaxID=2831512 RepID=A0AAN6MML0_9PEZI|nr:Pisatin demethylase [Staphylotrichum longicolle]